MLLVNLFHISNILPTSLSSAPLCYVGVSPHLLEWTPDTTEIEQTSSHFSASKPLLY